MMKKLLQSDLAILGLFLGIGIAFGGYFVSQTMVNAKVALNTAQANTFSPKTMLATCSILPLREDGNPCESGITFEADLLLSRRVFAPGRLLTNSVNKPDQQRMCWLRHLTVIVAIQFH